ncbi:tRNA (adenosine(37)-N6)-threonylcarbamoyltransferase complex ATPase subunit type 1 TsaE [Patescibacteria group bacterium]
MIVSLKELEKFAFDFAKSLEGGEVIALYGDLGSGKTTFTQFLAKALGVKKRVPSPTFIVMREYSDLNLKNVALHHYDFYRLDNLDEIQDLGVEEDFKDSKTICVIEWAEKVQDLLPEERFEIRFKTIDQNKREIEFDKI